MISALMRPLHTATRATESSSTLRKTSSRVILQIPESSSVDSRQRLSASGAAPGKSSSSFGSSCDTLFIILGLAVFLSVVGMVFVHRMFVESSAANSSLLNQETRGTGQSGWGSKEGNSFYR